MNEKERVSGNTTVAPEVIEAIVRMTTNDTDGVNHIYTTSSSTGVKIKIVDNMVNADVYVVLDQRENTVEVGRELQNKIARAISEMVGMKVGTVDIHVEDFEYPVAK